MLWPRRVDRSDRRQRSRNEKKSTKIEMPAKAGKIVQMCEGRRSVAVSSSSAINSDGLSVVELTD